MNIHDFSKKFILNDKIKNIKKKNLVDEIIYFNQKNSTEID